MKNLVSAFIFLFSISAGALSGSWKFTEMIYQGVRQAPLSPDLNLQWTFFENGTDRIYWDHQGIPGFCERFASYEVKEGSLLEEEVFAVNPKNNPECAKDVDMQVGRKTVNPIQILKHEILIQFTLGDEEIIYVLTPYVDGSSRRMQ